MSHFELIMPKMGESIEEATITKWFVKPGDKVKDDDVLVEIATDKVDSEIPSPVSGTVVRILANQDETLPVGAVIALIDTVDSGTEKGYPENFLDGVGILGEILQSCNLQQSCSMYSETGISQANTK